MAEKYRAVARRGAAIFFVMTQMQKIHTYYVYSLNLGVLFRRASSRVSRSSPS